MATAAKRIVKTTENAGESVSEALFDQVAALRREVASIADAVGDYRDHTLGGVQHNALALAREVGHQGAVVARQVSRQASVAGRAVHDNPVPVIVALGAIALLSALVFTRGQRLRFH